ncbi:hypothetical protein NC652_022548 [Populus alba x Populus x berolinensis]|nr:hypothetical protein NC652_022548 [Populus alba x Populus x berolinensis]
MRCIVANTILNVCHDGLHEIEEVEHLEATLTEDEIAYHNSVTSVLGPSTSNLYPSMSYDVISPFPTSMDISPSPTSIDITDMSLNWTSWSDVLTLYISALNSFTS